MLLINELNILEIRKSLKMTQLEFGELIGVDKRTIINYEQGKKIPTTKIKILEMMMAKGLLGNPMNNKEKTPIKNEIIIGDTEGLRREILDHKDHIKTLKQLIEEKDKLAEMYKNENVLLKARINALESK
jgi:transcriptional regulator with XRE-family HTH domain